MHLTSEAITELRLVAINADTALQTLGPAPRPGRLEDHRTEVIGQLLEACDRVDPGLGTRLLLAMYPTANGLKP